MRVNCLTLFLCENLYIENLRGKQNAELLKPSAVRHGFADDADAFSLFGCENHRLIFWIVGNECERIASVIHSFERCFIINDNGCNFAVINNVLTAEKNDIPVLYSCADHGIAFNAEAEIGIAVADHGAELMLLVCKGRFSGMDFAEHGNFPLRNCHNRFGQTILIPAHEICRAAF